MNLLVFTQLQKIVNIEEAASAGGRGSAVAIHNACIAGGQIAWDNLSVPVWLLLGECQSLLLTFLVHICVTNSCQIVH